MLCYSALFTALQLALLVCSLFGVFLFSNHFFMGALIHYSIPFFFLRFLFVISFSFIDGIRFFFLFEIKDIDSLSLWAIQEN